MGKRKLTNLVYKLTRMNYKKNNLWTSQIHNSFTLLSPALPRVNLFYRALPCFTRFKLFFTALPRLCQTYPFILSHAHFSILSTFSSSYPFCFRPPYPFMPRYAKLPRVYKLMLNLPLFLILMPNLVAFLYSYPFPFPLLMSNYLITFAPLILYLYLSFPPKFP
jgi:hypothetical protein